MALLAEYYALIVAVILAVTHLIELCFTAAFFHAALAAVFILLAHVYLLFVLSIVFHNNAYLIVLDLDGNICGVCLCCHNAQPQHCHGCQLDDVLLHIACICLLFRGTFVSRCIN